MENVKNPIQASMLCMIDGETFHSFTKNMWIGNMGASYHIPNDDVGLYDVTKINKFVQGSLGNMSITKRGKLCMKVCQVNGSKRLHIGSPWCANFWKSAKKWPQESHCDKIFQWQYHPRLLNQDSWWLAQLAESTIKKDTNTLHVELGDSSEVIYNATGRAMDLHLIGMLKPCEDCTLGKAKKGYISEKAIEHSTILGERLFFWY